MLRRGRDGVQQGVEAGQNEAFEDVQLGPLLGQGGFGKVYRGLWNGAAVAVKVCFVFFSVLFSSSRGHDHWTSGLKFQTTYQLFCAAAHSTERGSLQSGPLKSCESSCVTV